MTIIDTPDYIKQIVGLSSYDYTTPAPYIPQIKQTDLDYGYINRYFVGKINDSIAIETNASDFKMADSRLYKKIFVHWKITGPQFNIYDGKMLKTTGVVNYNNFRIQDIQLTFPAINLSPTQFWRGY